MNENLSSKDIGERIKQKLSELNLKQKDLVVATGLSKNAISNYISGNRVPDTKAIYRISKILCVSIEWLLNGENATTLITPIEIVDKLSIDEIRLIKSLRKLDEIDRAKIEGMVEIKVLELSDSKKEMLSAYQTGEESATKEVVHA